MLQGKAIWDKKTRVELTDIIRFQDTWYCGFREADQHGWDVGQRPGKVRIIRSKDTEQWESVALFSWEGADLREPRLAVTAEGALMADVSVTFRHGDRSATTDTEPSVFRQTVTWLSPDGERWSSAYACPTGVNTCRWATTWHDGMGYGVGKIGKDRSGTLYRTRDGKTWRVLLKDMVTRFDPRASADEATLAFDDEGVAYCMMRDAIPRAKLGGVVRDSDGHHVKKGEGHKTIGADLPMLGIGKPPYYQEWEWKELTVDYGAEHGGPRPAEEVFRAPFGGPDIIVLSDGRLVAAARMLGPGRDDGHITLFTVDPEKALLTLVDECTGTTYGGILEHDGKVWVSHAETMHRDRVNMPGDERVIRLASVDMQRLP